MTFVGKILVIIIMVFALFFLAITTVVFTTETNWKAAHTKQGDQIKKLQESVNTAKAEAASLGTELEKIKTAHKAELGTWDARKSELETQNKQRQDEITAQRTDLETALQNTKILVTEAEARKAETDLLRNTLDAVQKQANDFKLRQTELNDEILSLKRELDVAKNNNKALRDRVSLLTTVLRTHNLSADTERLARADNPPDVEGQVAKVDDRNTKVQITIGSDDGLVEGNTLFVYRTTQPDPGFIGKIQIDAVDPDQAVAHLIGRTNQGKKIKEGDIVTTKIGPRS
jgi:hypothetical protein